MADTKENLENAFAGESKANRMYTAFSRKANEEGLKQVGKLFRAVAAAETVHALNHFRAADKINSTTENLKTAIAGETYEFTEMYPAMIKDAENDSHPRARSSFNYANEVEKVHAELYKKALEKVESGSDLEENKMFVCQVCGFTVEGEAPDVCPICGARHDKFDEIE